MLFIYKLVEVENEADLFYRWELIGDFGFKTDELCQRFIRVVLGADPEEHTEDYFETCEHVWQFVFYKDGDRPRPTMTYADMESIGQFVPF